MPAALVTDQLPNFWYTLVDLGGLSDAELSHFPPLQAGLLVLKYATRDDDPVATLERLIAAAAGVGLTTVVLVVRYLFKASDGMDRTRLRKVLKRILPGQEEDVLSIAAQEIIAEVRPKFLAEGEAKGRAEGEARGKANMLIRLIRHRFPDLPPDLDVYSDSERRRKKALASGRWMDSALWHDSRRLSDGRGTAGSDRVGSERNG